MPGNPNIFGIGPLKEPLNQNLFENGPIPVGKSITITRAGEQIAGPIERSPYDVRDFKYLFAISPYGLHTVREMTPWRTNARGIVGHPQLAEQAAIGGEAFFDPDNRGTVYINFGSGRFPPGSTQAMDAAAKYWLACGMDKVVAVFSDRDFKVQAYELKDRYGKNLPNKVYLRANPIAAERVDSEFMPSVRTDQMVL